MIQISNLIEGGVTQDHMRGYIVDALEDLPADILNAVYKIIFDSESGIE